MSADPDLHQVRCFVAVAERLHFGGAAEHLHIAQSAVSRQIKLLETALGVRLIERNKRARPRLTEAGALFLAEARAAVAQFEKAASVARQAGRGALGRLEIGYVASATYSGLLPSVVSTYHRACPAVAIGLTEMDTPRQLEALREGGIDVGFFRPRPDHPAELLVLPQLREPIVLALRGDHPLAAAGGAILPARLAGEDFIVPQADDHTGFSEHTMAIGRAGGFTPHLAHHVRDFITVLNLVAAGLGVAAVPASLRHLRLADIVYRRLDGCAIAAELVAAVRRTGNAPVVGTFIETLRHRARTAPPARAGPVEGPAR